MSIGFRTAVPERIAQDVQSRLLQITVANGFNFDVASVARPQRDATDWTVEHLGMIVVNDDKERLPEHDYPGNPPALAYQLPIKIHCFVKLPDRTKEQQLSDRGVAHDMEAAAKKAVAMNDIHWVRLGGAAYDAMWDQTTEAVSEEMVLISLTLNTRYRVSELDPYEVR